MVTHSPTAPQHTAKSPPHSTHLASPVPSPHPQPLDRQDTLLLASYAPTSSQRAPGLSHGCSSLGASSGAALDTHHLPLVSPEVTAPPIPITFQGHRLEEAKLLQHLDEEDQDHQHCNHLKAFQVHGEGVSWPLTPPSLPTTVLEPLTPAPQPPDHTSPGTPVSLAGIWLSPPTQGHCHQPWVTEGSAQGCGRRLREARLRAQAEQGRACE